MTNYRRSYQAGGTCFLTAALADRSSCLLVDNIELLRSSLYRVKARLPFTLIGLVVLPEHFHVVWRLPSGDGNFSRRMQFLKYAFSSALPPVKTISASRLKKHECEVWQRRFWEHCIRDENDLRRHVDYVHMNPQKHGLVERVGDWPHSTFHEYVRQGVYLPDWAGVMTRAGEESFGE